MYCWPAVSTHSSQQQQHGTSVAIAVVAVVVLLHVLSLVFELPVASLWLVLAILSYHTDAVRVSDLLVLDARPSPARWLRNSFRPAAAHDLQLSLSHALRRAGNIWFFLLLMENIRRFVAIFATVWFGFVLQLLSILLFLSSGCSNLVSESLLLLVVAF